MKCPFCQHSETEVKDSRIIDDGAQVRRRRNCLKCKNKFTTIERTHLKELFVIRRSGVTKKFDSSKIAKSIDMAMRKRPISEKKIKQMVDHIVQKIENLQDKEIPSKKIGEMIMAELAIIDPVAYIRFASIYRSFKDSPV
jgi:transcriptional repressor NrdR